MPTVQGIGQRSGCVNVNPCMDWIFTGQLALTES